MSSHRAVSPLEHAAQKHGHNKAGRAPVAERCTIEAQIVATTAPVGRIMGALREGSGRFILSSADGRMAARVELSLLDAGLTEHRIGSARVVVDWSRGTVTNGDRRTALSRTELRLFAALMAADGRALSRTELIERVWPGDEMPSSERENALAVYVCSLRKRLTSVGICDALVTVRGVGYRAAM
jgi:DNA-binding response OmpR family regulator